MTNDQADAIWTILVENAGASPRQSVRADFVALQMPELCEDYRFQGLLGFGGKFWNYDGRWYVTLYAEDETPERLAIVEKVNALLKDLKSNGAT